MRWWNLLRFSALCSGHQKRPPGVTTDFLENNWGSLDQFHKMLVRHELHLLVYRSPPHFIYTIL